MNGDTPRRWRELGAEPGPVDPARPDALWADLDVVEATAILGSWRGFAFPTGHHVERLPASSRWYGKRFTAPDDAQPLIYRPLLRLRPGTRPRVTRRRREHDPSTRVLDWSPDDQCLPHRAGALRR